VKVHVRQPAASSLFEVNFLVMINDNDNDNDNDNGSDSDNDRSCSYRDDSDYISWEEQFLLKFVDEAVVKDGQLSDGLGVAVDGVGELRQGPVSVLRVDVEGGCRHR